MKKTTKLIRAQNQSLKVRKACKAVYDCRIIQKLAEYNPTIVSTILVGLDTDNSDIDIICSYNSQSAFFHDLKSLASNYCDKKICKKEDNYVIARFQYANFLFEIFGTNQKIEEQMAFRHY